jgi:Carboxypeptidase regulatory-like domain/TonB-dependent Receptor Plug Domain
MLGRLLRIAILLSLSLSLATTAVAQVQTGSIFVRAIDEQGASMPGVSIEVTSPVLPKPLVAVTDSTGVYRFPALSFGTYTVKMTLSGFQTVVRERLNVVQNETVTLNITMRIGGMSEEVSVVGEAPVVDTKNAAVNTNLDAKLLDTTPGGKDIWNILEYKIPGLVFNTPDVGGNQAGLQRAFTSRGSSNSQNVQLLNGVNVGDPAAIGYSMNYYEPSTFENIQVTTGAQDISMGTSGTLINMVTRSGTNRFTGKTLFTYQGHQTQTDNVDEALKQAGMRPGANAVDYISNFNAQAGGPLIQNRLFYFGSFNEQQTHVNVPGFPAIIPTELQQYKTLSGNNQDSTDITSITGKLNYALSGSNRLEGYANYQWYDKPNRGANAASTQDSASKEHDTFPIAQLLWNSVLSDRSFLDTKLSANNTHFPLSQKTGLQPLFDASTGVQQLNRSSDFLTFRRRVQFTSNFQYFVPEALGARHEFKVGFDNAYTAETRTDNRVDGLVLRYNSLPTPSPVRVDIYGYPLVREMRVMNSAFYGQDSISFGRVTLVAGIRWERVEGYLPAQTYQDTTFFPVGTTFTNGYTIPQSFDEVRDAPLWHNWAPRVSLTYDLRGDGKTALKFSSGKYLEQIGTGTPGPNPNGTVTQRYGWNDLNGDLQFQRGNAAWDPATARYVGGEFGSLQRTSLPSLGSPFDPKRERSYAVEYTVGVDHELVPGVRLSATFIHRENKNVYGNVDVDINQWDQLYSPVTVTEQGRDGVFGTADDQQITVYQLNDPNTVVSTINRNDSRLGTKYNGLEITMTRRFANGWTFLGGYTYSHTRQDVVSLADPNDYYVNAKGETDLGRRHIFKASGSYELPYHIVFGANMRVQSGLPITRTVTIENLTQGNVGVNAEPRGSVRLPKLFTLDLRAGRFFELGRNRLELSVDVYNVTNANTIYAVRTNTGLTNVRYAGDATAPTTTIPSFLSPTGFLGPRILRFNATFSFGR